MRPPTLRAPRLSSLSKPHAVITQIIHRVPLAQERITQDSQRPGRFRDINALEGRDTRTLHVEDVVLGADGEVVAGEGEGQVREGVAGLAVDGVLAVEAFLCADFFVAVGGLLVGM